MLVFLNLIVIKLIFLLGWIIGNGKIINSFIVWRIEDWNRIIKIYKSIDRNGCFNFE